MKTRIFYENVNYRLRGSRNFLKVIGEVIREYRNVPGSLSFIFMTDEELLQINREFLNHDYYTDVITFDYGNSGFIEAEIYMSIETIKKNSHNYKVSLKEEVKRVMIHGALHICGFEDSTEKEKEQMRIHEDKWIKKSMTR